MTTPEIRLVPNYEKMVSVTVGNKTYSISEKNSTRHFRCVTSDNYLYKTCLKPSIFTDPFNLKI